MNTQAMAQTARLAVSDGKVYGLSYSVISPTHNEQTILGFQGAGADHLPLDAHAHYDLASLTKVVATTTRLLQLLVAGKLDLNQPVGQYVAGLATPELTIGQLLLHRSGLPADLPNVHQLSAQQLKAAVKAAQPHFAPGSQMEYSDLNFILLGWVIQAIDGALATSIKDHVLAPLGMADSGYAPQGIDLCQFVPTESVPDRGGIVRGAVHDHKAYLLNGVSGHAGLFSTLGDLTHFAAAACALTQNPAYSDEMRDLLAQYNVDGRTLGWRRWRSEGAQYWHTGFTGTSIAFDAEQHRGFVCLTNRIYPTRQKREFLAVRKQLLTEFFDCESEWTV
ncbi:serine hydrolase domain-containing protein [Lacticaseibacillus jixiensis]|uniref:serine hydrolase domain-containing protein n=1 Tax=Lacticaseibacillus jixiensis TaxID=3231926 RepID=UPI0036F3AF02